jgi:membrane-associated phospholipid phosphatase
VSIVLTGALVVHVLGLHRVLRWSMWVFFVLTVVSTVYFGWHYLVDDVAGVVIAVAAVWIGGRASGYLPSRADRRTAQAAEPVAD